jgi:hypothetical protein
MGVSASASIRVGFEVNLDDFWTSETVADDHLSCPKGHTEGAVAGRHCSECGGKFDHQTREVNTPSHELKQIAVAAGMPAEKVVPTHPLYWAHNEAACFDGLEIHSGDGYDDADTEADTWAMGLTLLNSGDFLHGEKFDNFKSSSQVQDAIRRVTKIRNLLGLEERPVGIYLTGYCSY